MQNRQIFAEGYFAKGDNVNTKHRTFIRLPVVAILYGLVLVCTAATAKPPIHWFDKIKQQYTDEQLYGFLYSMPKGGDLHHHNSGSNFSEWWYELATDQKNNGGYQYYTKTQIKQCKGYGNNEFGRSPSLILFRNIQESQFKQLDKCEKSEYKTLEALNADEKRAWLNSIRLDAAHEGREEFFQKHWQRLNALTSNPIISADMLVKNMDAMGQEGLQYLEAQMNPSNHIYPDGRPYSAESVAELFRKRLQQKDAINTGVTVRLQYALLRFLPNAEQILQQMYRFVDLNRDLYVGINMVGREDNDKGHPLRFLTTLRELRQTLPEVKLAIHAGEVDEPNYHVRDTLLLGADRIGHGLNLITDPQTLLFMRHNRYLVEINLISNLKLEYVSKYSEHPFPEYLRTGIPVALSTDDRGMWDSNLTDEFFVAVKEFNLSWDEVVSLSRNSLRYSFLEQKTKSTVLRKFEKRISDFENSVRDGTPPANKVLRTGKFICQNYSICLSNSAH